MNGRHRDRLLQKSNWYGTRQRTAPVIQRIRMAAVSRLWAPCHEGVWRSWGKRHTFWTVVFWDERLVSRSYRFTVGGTVHWYSLDGRRRVGPEEPVLYVAESRKLPWRELRTNSSVVNPADFGVHSANPASGHKLYFVSHNKWRILSIKQQNSVIRELVCFKCWPIQDYISILIQNRTSLNIIWCLHKDKWRGAWLCQGFPSYNFIDPVSGLSGRRKEGRRAARLANDIEHTKRNMSGDARSSIACLKFG